MAYVYDGDIYRGGGTGVTSDFGLRDEFARRAAEALTYGMNMPTQGQVDAGQKQLGYTYGMYQDIFQNGLMTPEQEQAILSNRVQQVNNQTRGMQQAFNAAQAQRGLGGNAGATMAASMAGQFAGGAARGQAFADIQASEAKAREMAAGGIERVGNSSAALHQTPVRMDVDENAYMDLYNKWRNSQVGYDGAKWGSKPQAPDFFDDPMYGAGGAGGGMGYQYGSGSGIDAGGNKYTIPKGLQNKMGNFGGQSNTGNFNLSRVRF